MRSSHRCLPFRRPRRSEEAREIPKVRIAPSRLGRALLAITATAIALAGQVASGHPKFVVGHQMLPMPRYGGSTSVEQMREEVRMWKDMGLDAVMLFDIGGTDGGGPQLAANGLKYHEAGVAEGFKFAMSMSYFPSNEVQRYVDYIKGLSDPKYAAARFMVDGKPYLSAYHASVYLNNVASQLTSEGYPVYFEPMVFPRGFFGDPNTQGWENGYITAATPDTWNVLYSHADWQGAQGFAAFEIAKSIPDQANQIDYIWNAAKAHGKTARGSIVAYYKGFAHKGNWMCYESWGYTRLQNTFKRAIDANIPAVEFITLNDFSESSYVNSWAEGDPPIIVNHWNTGDLPPILDHSGFRYFAKRYIQWFKTGQEPPITEDELYYAYRLHPRDAADYYTLPDSVKASLQKWIPTGQPADWIYRKGGLPSSYSGWGPNYSSGIDWGKFSDGIHVAVRLKEPADVYINGVLVGDHLSAGEHLLVKPGERYDGESDLGYPLYTFGASDFGYPTFKIVRNGQIVLEHTGELEITPYPVPGCWNMFARKAPSSDGSTSGGGGDTGGGSDPTPEPSPTSTPFGGSAINLPGRVEAENYDDGADGVAYHDTTTGNITGVYRTDNVDLEANSDGYHIAFFNAGEWTRYTINVDTAGHYLAGVRVASSGPGGTICLKLDGQNISGSLEIPDTGGWSSWQTLEFPADLTAGEHVLDLVGLTNASGSDFIGNVDWIDFASDTQSAPVAAPVPTITAPLSGASVAVGSSVTLAVSLTGDTNSLQSVSYYADTNLIGTATVAPWTHTWQPSGPGQFAISAVATLSSGESATSDPVDLEVAALAQSERAPYPNTRATVPGRVEAENFDQGGEGVAYSDRTAENISGAYRSEGVDIEANAEGQHVSWFQAGEWMLYSITAPATGQYSATVRVASSGTGGLFRIEIDGVDVSGLLRVPDTGGWTSWQTVSFDTAIQAGNHDLRIVAVENAGNVPTLTVGNIDWIDFARIADESPAPTPSITSPANGTTYDQGETISISVSLAGDATKLDRIELYADDTRIGQLNTAPWSMDWSDGSSGTHVLSVVAFNAGGAQAASIPVEVTIREEGEIPALPAGAVANVRDFGATGDGVTDDTWAIRDALAAIGPAGGTVYLPAGTYRIAPQSEGADALEIAFDNTTLVGDGPEKTVLSFNTFGGRDPATHWELLDGAVHRGSAIVVHGSPSPFSPRRGVVISKLRITGNASPTGNPTAPANPETGDGWDKTHHAIVLEAGTSISGVRLDHLDLDNFRGEIVLASDPNFGLLEISHCSIRGSNAIGLAVSADLRLIGNDIFDHAFACVVGDHANRAGSVAQHGYYLDNIFEADRTLGSDGLNGLILRGEGDSGTDANLADDSLFIVVQKNVFRNCRAHGLLADAELHGAVIEANDFVDNGTDAEARHGSLALVPGSASDGCDVIENVVVRNNRFSTSFGNDSGHAIYLNAGAHTLRNIEMTRNSVENTEDDSLGVQRFLVLESAPGSVVHGLVFSGNTANAIRLAVEDLTKNTHPTPRPRYSDNNVFVTGSAPGDDTFTLGDSSGSIQPSWSVATIHTPTVATRVTLAPMVDLFPDLTCLELIASDDGNGFVIEPDSTWNRLPTALTVTPGESISLVKRAGRFEVGKNDTSDAAPTAPASTAPLKPLDVILEAPPEGSSVPSGQEVEFHAEVTGDLARVAYVDFFADGSRIARCAAEPFSATWSPSGAGTFVAFARVTANDGSSTLSRVATFVVDPPPNSGSPADNLQHADVGSPAAPGTTTFDVSTGIYTVSAAGSPLAGARDQFRFDQQRTSGDAEVVVRVTSLVASDPGAKAGLMMRVSAHPKAPYVAIFVTPTQGIAFQFRDRHGSESVTRMTSSYSAPIWLRLRREGSQFFGAVSWDGENWNDVDQATVGMPDIIDSGLATSSGREDQRANATYESASIRQLPEIFAPSDIGMTGTAGFTIANEDSDTTVVAGAGYDIYGRRDSFHFASRSVSGNATVMTQVAAFDAEQPRAKAGLMIRDGLTPDAAHVSVVVTPKNGVMLESRLTSGATTSTTMLDGVSAPVFLALEREGGSINAYLSTDGTSWEPIGRVEIDFPETVSMGMAVSSSNPSALATAKFVSTGIAQ